MKKGLLCFILAALFLLVSCTNDNEVEQKPLPEENTNAEEVVEDTEQEFDFTAADFLPFIEDTKFMYMDIVGENEDTVMAYFDYINDNIAQWYFEYEEEDYSVVTIFVHDDDGVWCFEYDADYKLENVTEKLKEVIEASEEEKYYIIKNPIVAGTRWGDDDDYYIISSIERDNTTEEEIYYLTVDNIYGDYTLTSVFQKGIGLIEARYSNEEKTVLTEVIQDTGRDVLISVYQPYETDYEYRDSEKIMEHRTNEPVENLLAKAFVDVENEDYMPLMNSSAELLKFTIDHKNGVAIVDFNQDFVYKMNLGSGFESLALNCIAATVMDFSFMDQVSITIEGEAYSSGHIYMETDEYYNRETVLQNF